MRRVWSIVKSLLLSGLMGAGIGMIWFTAEAVYYDNYYHASTVPTRLLLLYTPISFLIGVLFNLAFRIFNKTEWSLRKQLIVNFLVCYLGWLLLELIANSFQFNFYFFIQATWQFLLMYVLTVVIYFIDLRHDIKQINQKLRENRNKK